MVASEAGKGDTRPSSGEPYGDSHAFCESSTCESGASAPSGCADDANRPDATRHENAGTGRAQPSWYVIQVSTGQENKVCQTIHRVAGSELVSECFTPRYATEKKVKGEWVYAESLLLPGYVIAVTHDVRALSDRLKGVYAFTRLLTSGGDFYPLDQEDRAWLSAFTSAGDRVVPMSMGCMEGDKVVVFRGPLKGREACIVSVNRRKSTAIIELDMCGRRVRTRIGLGIVRKCQCPGGLRTT